MIHQHIYKPDELPPEMKWQILSFIRMQWPDGFVGVNELRDWISSEKNQDRLHFVLVEENNILVSHVEVFWRYLEHQGNRYKAFALSGVLTYPQFRNRGYGISLVKQAREYIEKQDGDIVVFTSEHTGFYEKAGFTRLNQHLLTGDSDKPEVDPENVFMLFTSEKGKAGRKDFESTPLYVGEHSW